MKILRLIFGISRRANFNRITLFQILSQSIAGIISFILILLGTFLFMKSLKNYIIHPPGISPDFYILIKALLSSFELFFMAPIPFLVIFSHRRNINQAFGDLLPVQQKSALDLDEVKAKKGFISSIIGIISTFILGLFFEFFSREEGPNNLLFENRFGYCLAIIGMLFLFLIILIFYYKMLSHHEDKNVN